MREADRRHALFCFGVLRAALGLCAMPGDDEQVQYRTIDPLTIEADVAHGITMNEVFERLKQAEVKVQSMRPKANRLEELFVSLVEKNLEKVAK